MVRGAWRSQHSHAPDGDDKHMALHKEPSADEKAKKNAAGGRRKSKGMSKGASKGASKAKDAKRRRSARGDAAAELNDIPVEMQRNWGYSWDACEAGLWGRVEGLQRELQGLTARGVR